MPSGAAIHFDGWQGGGVSHGGAMVIDDNAARRQMGAATPAE
jgi:hypothetical protein